MKKVLAAAWILLLFAACGGEEFGEQQACDLAKEFLTKTKEAGWQFHDAYRYPPVSYKNMEVLECFDFVSDVERGWAKISVRAMGDEYHAEQGTLLGRKELQPTFEFDRYDQGWRIVEE
jgi:hypothetical protein